MSNRIEPIEMLHEIRVTLSRVYHDTNNPLAIISGNAQFLLELSRVTDMDEDLRQPIQDIDEASTRVAESLKDLASLREQIAQYLRQEDHSDSV